MSTPVWSRKDVPIQSVDDWQTHASMKGNWRTGYSALELARLWMTDAGVAALAEAMAPTWPGLTVDAAIAEAQIAFDSYRGGVRNHDVLAYGQANLGGVVIGVEGKVNESLDATIARKSELATELKADGKTTNLDQRLDGLLLAIAGRSLKDDPSLGELRYQLFSAVAGTLAAARHDTVAAAVVIHLIDTPNAKPKKFDATRAAVTDFASALHLDAEGPLSGPLELNAEHAHLLAVPYPVPLWLTVIETPPAADPDGDVVD